MPPAPVAIYLLNEGTGTVAHDTGGSGFNGTLTGGADIPTWSPYGLNFNGAAAAKVSLPDGILGASCGDFSLEAWIAIQASPASGANGSIVTLDGEDILLDITVGGFLDGQAYTDPTGSTLIGEVTSATPTPTVFTHIVYTRCSTAMHLYVNGVLNATASCSSATVTLNANPGTSALGADTAFALHAFTGLLGETRLYNVCLSSSDVASVFAAHGARYGYAPVAPPIMRCIFADEKTQAGASDLWSTYRTSPGVWSKKTLLYSIKNNPPPGWTSGEVITGFSGAAHSAGPAPSFLASLEDGSASFDSEQLYEVVDNVTPPLVIDGANFPDIIGQGMNYFTTSQGPWVYKGARWCIGEKVNASTAIGTLAVYKKVGASWVEQDPTHSPTGWPTAPFFSLFSGSNSYNFSASNSAVYLDEATGIIHCAYLSSAGTFSLIEFDLNPGGGWGSPHDPVSIAGTVVLFMACLLPVANGDVNLFYQVQASSTQADTFLQTLHAGLWSAAVQVSNGTSGANVFNQVFVDPSDPTVLHSVWVNIPPTFNTTSPFVTAYYQRIVAGVLGTFFSFPANHGMDTPSNAFGHGRLDSGAIFLPFDNRVTGLGNRPSLLIGTPLSAPSWSAPELIDVDVTDQATCTFLTLEGPPPTPPPPTGRVGVGSVHYRKPFYSGGGVMR